jgi:hypothetical protein
MFYLRFKSSSVSHIYVTFENRTYVHTYIHEEIRSRLNSGNACYHAVQNLLSSHLLPRNMKIKMYKTIILPVALYGCET